MAARRRSETASDVETMSEQDLGGWQLEFKYDHGGSGTTWSSFDGLANKIMDLSRNARITSITLIRILPNGDLATAETERLGG